MTGEDWSGEKVRAEISRMMAETAKLSAETGKVKRESWWYPLVVITAMVAAIVGLSKLIG
jgi:hypothetical protein